MNNISIAIVDENKFYTKALSEYLQNEYGQVFDVSCFTSVESLKQYLNSGCDTDIMLIDWKLYEEALRAYKINSILILSENSLENDINGIKTLYKYQRADLLAKQILQSLDSVKGKTFKLNNQQKTAKLIAVYSAAGGAGKSTIVYNLGRQYAVLGKKALLLSMEAYSAMPMFAGEQKNHGLSYLLYLVKTKSDNLQIKLDTLIEKDSDTEMYFLPRGCNSIEYKDIDASDMTSLMEILRSQSGCDAVLLDMDSSINEIVLSIFKHSDLIINVIADDSTSKAKNDSFVRQLEVIGNSLNINLADKMINVNNKIRSQSEDNIADNNGDEITANIPYINDYSKLNNVYFPELASFKKLYEMIDNLNEHKRL